MKIFNLFFCIIFAVFAALQYNDSAFYVWMPIYLYAAVLCWLTSNHKYYPNAYFIGILIYVVYASYNFFDKDGVMDWMQKHNAENIVSDMQAQKPWIEETRDFFGLVILIVVLLIDYIYSKRRIRHRMRPHTHHQLKSET